jgi:hypothetical protein
MYARFILFNLIPNCNPGNLRKENLNPNLGNPKKERKSFLEVNHL